MTQYTSGSINISGLGSETDWDTIIEAQLTAASYRYNQMEEWKSEWDEKASALRELNSLLLAYETALEDFNTTSKFLSKAATSSDSSLVGVDVDSDADSGSHNVVVGQLATNDVWVTGTGFTDTAEAITDTDTTLTFEYAGEEYSLEVAAGTTVSEFVSQFNSNPDTKDLVRAQLISNGSEYYIQFKGMDLGADNTLVFTDTGSLDFTAAAMEQTQTAGNAKLKVDGWPTAADQWIERDTNHVSDIIEGVTLHLYDTTSADGIEVNIEVDTDTMLENILTFVDYTNQVRAAITGLDAYDDTTSSSDDEDEDSPVDVSGSKTGRVLSGNYGIEIVEQNLKGIVSSTAPGFAYYDSGTGMGDLYSSLAQIGITTCTDQDSDSFGLLEVDEDVLQKALEADPEAVAELFAANGSGTTDTNEVSFISTVEGITSPGEYDIEYEIDSVTGELVSATINGNAASISGWTITGAAGTPESGLSLRVNTRTAGTHEASARVKQGMIPALIDEVAELTDSEGGVLTIIADNYDEIITNTEKKMEQEQARLDRLERDLTNRYAKLEALLAELEGIQDSLESQISQLSSD